MFGGESDCQEGTEEGLDGGEDSKWRGWWCCVCDTPEFRKNWFSIFCSDQGVVVVAVVAVICTGNKITERTEKNWEFVKVYYVYVSGTWSKMIVILGIILGNKGEELKE